MISKLLYFSILLNIQKKNTMKNICDDFFVFLQVDYKVK